VTRKVLLNYKSNILLDTRYLYVTLFVIRCIDYITKVTWTNW